MPSNNLMEWVLGTGFSLTILITFILVIRKPFARQFGAKAAYALWALPALRLFMPAMSLPVLTPSLPEITPHINYMGVDMLSLAADTATQTAPLKTDFSLIAGLFWGGGAVLWLTWQLTRQHMFARRLRDNSRDITTLKTGLYNAGLDKAVHKLGFKQTPHIRISLDNSGPLVTGLFRPMIILPAKFEAEFTPHQQHLTLLHEMAHIRRNDLWAAFAAILLRAVYWPHPLIHYAARKFRTDQEAACDASVLKLTQTRVSVYAETLMQAAKSASQPKYEAPLGLTIYHPLKERLIMMKTQNTRASLRSRAAAGVLLLSVCALTAPITLAENTSESVLAGAPASQNTSRQKIKLIEDINGVQTEKKYEIETVNGVTRAWSIDEWGHKMEVDVEKIKGLNHMHHFDFSADGRSIGPGQMTLRDFKTADGKNKTIIKRAIKQGARYKFDQDGNRTTLKAGEFPSMSDEDIKALINSHGSHIAIKGNDGKDIKIMTMTSEAFGKSNMDENTTVIVENLSEHDMDFEFAFENGQYGPSQMQHAKAMMNAVSGILEGVQTDELSSKAQRKIEKARKALQEAQEAVNASK